MRRPFMSLMLVPALLAACSDSGDKAAGSTAAEATEATASTAAIETTTTVPLADQALAYSEAGPFPVGVTTLQLAKGPKVEVWYPAVAGSTGTEAYDTREFVPAAIRALLTADIPAGYTTDTARDAAVADGAFPVVLFSHGAAGFRVQSSFLTSTMASWGMIVISPDHPSRDLTAVLGGTASRDRNDSVDDLLQSLDLITAEGADTTSPFFRHVDTDHVAAVGHSAGGGTALLAASDPRVDGYVSLASGVVRAAEGSTTTVAAPPMPDKPSFFIAGALDGVALVDTVTRPGFELARSPSRLWVIDGVGHNGFTDFCTFGDGAGIIGVARASGLGALLESQPTIVKLGSDGCAPPALPVTDTFPIIRHAVIAWVRQLFGVDTAPVGLDSDVAGEYVTAVEITTK